MTCFNVKFPDIDSDGFLDNKHGGNCSKEFLDEFGYPDFSPHVVWDKVENAKSYALECIDYDATIVCGKIFVHWSVANILDNKLQANASRLNKEILQGVNSITNGFIRSELDENQKNKSNLDTSRYIGPMPPDRDHHYLFNVYALDIEKLELKMPFFINELHDKMRGHIIGIGRGEFKYRQFKGK